ncbi:MAG: imidazole glycerol phosphate synthase subunit HisH [Promethearchaeota archaeon]
MPVKIAIIDYEMGNLKSINKLLKHLNVKSIITSNSNEILDSDGVILPGVGAFGDAMMHLRKKELIPVINEIIQEKKPLFGICLGLQLLFSKSHEMGEHLGLNIIKGEVILFDKREVGKVPQIGWNSVDFQNSRHYLFKEIPNNSYFYFVHGYYGVPEKEDNILGTTKYGEIKYCSIVHGDNFVATQFHPEKSGKNGIKMMKNFIQYCKK